ncbi:VOC family protein [Bacteroidota bacterium]
MSENKTGIGTVSWVDLTVNNAEELKDFYKEVIGWKTESVPMGDYHDFNMISPGTQEVQAGICNAKGANSNLPSHWMIYLTVENVNKSAESCRELGGKIIIEPKNMGNYGRCAVIQDPAGAVCALFTPSDKK